jgi:hypothetical protein
METTMALLRQCLQELRTRHHEWDVPAGGWPQSRPMLQQALRELSLPAHAERNHRRREIASHGRPAA